MVRFLLCTLLIFSFVVAGNAIALEQQVLHRGNGAEVQTLDPHLAEGVPAANILDDLYEGLVTRGRNGEFAPGVAESWEILDEGKRYLFYLRKNARWSNGDSLTAEDFVYSLRRILDPRTASSISQFLSPIAGAEAVMRGEAELASLAVRALQPHLLEIRLKAPAPYFLILLRDRFGFPVHRQTVEQHGDQFSRPGKLVSNGAYTLREWVVQSHIMLQKNPYYWDAEATAIEQVYFYPIEDQNGELNRYRAGELDYTYEIPNKKFRWVRQNLGDQLKIHPYTGVYYYGFNLTRPPFKGDRKLRQALSLAIDRDVITDKITGTGEKPAFSWVPGVFNDYSSQSLSYKDLSRKEQIALARRLYQEAGYSAANPLALELRYNTSENHKKIAIVVAAMWKQVLGVQTRLLNEEWKVFLKNRNQKLLTQVFRAGFIGYFPYTYLELMHSAHQMNDTGYSDADYDALLQKAALESNTEKRQRLMQQAEKMILDEQVVIPIFSYVSKHLLKPHVGGYAPNIEDKMYSKNLFLKNR